MGIPLFRAGHWKYATALDLEAWLGEVQRDIAGLAALARAASMTVLIANVPGEFGGAIWDTWLVMRGMDPRTVGYDYDAGYAAEAGPENGESALRLVLPRIRAVAARDFYWSKESGAWKRVACPLGEGVVDWARLFRALAGAHFTGPVTVTVDYQPGDPPGAIKRDVAFLRKQVEAAYA
jgi:sugar phosphate isomerase/epimerase